jgi:hypothetical protein
LEFDGCAIFSRTVDENIHLRVTRGFAPRDPQTFAWKFPSSKGLL